MTQTPQTQSIADVMTRDLVSPTAFEKEGIWLPAMTVQHWNAGQMVIEGKTFTDCLIEGPAVMAIMDGTVFDNCQMGVAADIRTLLYRPLSTEKMAGLVGMKNCRFIRCRFFQVGFTGAESVLETLLNDVTMTSGGKPKESAS